VPLSRQLVELGFHVPRVARGAALTRVRDNLRHAWLQTTSIYLHNDESIRAREMDKAFGGACSSHSRAAWPNV
jgi:hypothetical protein